MRILPYMTKPVTLSNRAFTALRGEKKSGESDSDVVLRLIDALQRPKADPSALIRAPLKRALAAGRHRDLVRQWRDAEGA